MKKVKNTAGMPSVASLVRDLPFEREKMPSKANKCLLLHLVHFAFTYEFNFWDLYVLFFEPTSSSFNGWTQTILSGMELGDVEMLPLLPSASQASVPTAGLPW